MARALVAARTRQEQPWHAVLLLCIALASAVDGKEASQTYVFPIVEGGPYSQRTGLRQLAAIAKVLDRGLLLTGLFQHYLDTAKQNEEQKCSKQPRNHSVQQASQVCSNATAYPLCFPAADGFMDFERVLDVAPFSAFLPAATVAEYKAQGWDGTIDALVHVQGCPLDRTMHHMKMLQKAIEMTGAKVARKLTYISVNAPLKCDPKQIAELKEKLKPHRVVAIMPFALDRAALGSYDLLLSKKVPEQGVCKQAVYYAEHLCRTAPWLRQIATAFIKKRIGSQPYLAVHVRPYPDTCLEAWGADKLNGTHLQQVCKSVVSDLHITLAQKVKAKLAEQDLKHVFIMAHPSIRRNIDKLLAKEHVEAVYLEEDMLQELARCVDRTATFMSFVEEEIVVQSHTFLGTASSSMTLSMLGTRIGQTQNKRNYFFDKKTL